MPVKCLSEASVSPGRGQVREQGEWEHAGASRQARESTETREGAERGQGQAGSRSTTPSLGKPSVTHLVSAARARHPGVGKRGLSSSSTLQPMQLHQPKLRRPDQTSTEQNTHVTLLRHFMLRGYQCIPLYQFLNQVKLLLIDKVLCLFIKILVSGFFFYKELS